jgi:excisionase family DNA binding protein
MAYRLTLTVEEAAEILGISRSSAYEAVGRGEIPSLRFGKRIVIPRAALFRLVDEPSSNGEPTASEPDLR